MKYDCVATSQRRFSVSVNKGRASSKTGVACWVGRKNYATHQVNPPSNSNPQCNSNSSKPPIKKQNETTLPCQQSLYNMKLNAFIV